MSQSDSFDQTHFIALSGSDKTIKPGDIVGENYALLSLLGEGGMGYVFLAEHNIIGKKYALKIVRPDRLDDTSKQRFKTEARVIARLDHPNIVKIYNMGVYLEDCPYYVMDLLDGKALSEHIQEGTNFKIEELLNIFMQVAQGLEYAHKKGIVHRDIKPSNIVLNAQKDGYRAQLVDFGIAKVVNQDIAGQARTATGLIFGSPYYMSPEQCLGQTIDGRSDIYSLGCTLYECLSGEPPFMGQNAMHTMMMHQESPTPVLRQPTSDPALNQSINFLIAKMTAKQPQKRYQSMQQIAHDLERMSNYRPIADIAMSVSLDMATESTNLEKIAIADSISQNNSRSKHAIALAVSLVCTICAISAFIYYNHDAQTLVLKPFSKTPLARSNKATNSPIPKDSPALAKLKVEMSKVAPIKPKLVLIDGQQKRQIDFPPQGIGKIFDTERQVMAAETVYVKPTGGLIFGIDENDFETAFAYPQLFSDIAPCNFAGLAIKAKTFKGYEFAEKKEIKTQSTLRLNGLLRKLPKWRELTSLSMNELTLDKESIKLLEEIPNLSNLALFNPTYDKQELTNSILLDRLSYFLLDNPTYDGNEIFDKLSKSKLLTSLILRRIECTSQDLDKLSCCQNLKFLVLDHLIIDDPLLVASLLKLTNTATSLQRMTLTEQSLKMINSAKTNNITIFDYPSEKLPALKARYPKVKFGGSSNISNGFPDFKK